MGYNLKVSNGKSARQSGEMVPENVKIAQQLRDTAEVAQRMRGGATKERWCRLFRILCFAGSMMQFMNSADNFDIAPHRVQYLISDAVRFWNEVHTGRQLQQGSSSFSGGVPELPRRPRRCPGVRIAGKEEEKGAGLPTVRVARTGA
ncbi:hypothetical protein FCM35_KLT10232 [Carex littledalei]|uniref:Uncharacterized protein n=1 Tax=Carex littledalei TaxID=544730 RepID=A0A833QTZ0_9POAL|nr:hypothetical protein FCM35_KLT10232 [Carex littledalei]